MTTNKPATGSHENSHRQGRKPDTASLPLKTEPNQKVHGQKVSMSEKSRHLRRGEVLEMVGVSKTTLHERINDGLFPEPICGVAGKRYIESEVQEVMRAREAGCSGDEIRALVRGLAAGRAQPGWIDRGERVSREATPQTEKPKQRMSPILQLAGEMALAISAMKPPSPPKTPEQEVEELDRPSENQNKKLLKKIWSSLPAEKYRMKSFEKCEAMVTEAASKWKLCVG